MSSGRIRLSSLDRVHYLRSVAGGDRDRVCDREKCENPSMNVEVGGPQGKLIEAMDGEIHCMSDEPIVIEKMYGPLVFAGLRITADSESCEWVIDRATGPDGEYREWARVPGQLDENFLD